MDETPDALEKATELVKTGRLSDAKDCLLQYLRQNPSSEQAWLLMSYTVSNSSQQKDCLERVLQINPNNSVARSKLATLAKTPPTPAPKPPIQEPAEQPPAPAPFAPPARVSLPVPEKDDTHHEAIFSKAPPPLLKKEDASQEAAPAMNAIPARDASGPSTLSRLRMRAALGQIPDTQKPMTAGQPSEPEKNDEELQESFHMGPHESHTGRPSLRVWGIVAAVIVIILIVILAISGVFHFPLAGSTPTPIPSATPIALSLPPAWTRTPTLTPTITPTVTETPTLTLSPTSTIFLSHTPTKPKK